jgi:hypothetical protein
MMRTYNGLAFQEYLRGVTSFITIFQFWVSYVAGAVEASDRQPAECSSKTPARIAAGGRLMCESTSREVSKGGGAMTAGG